MKQAALDKLLHDTLKESAKKRNWNFSRGFVFKATELLFFSLIVVAQAKRFELSFSLRYKLLEFDDLFWSIVQLQENKTKPLSFRASGAWTAPTATISDGSVSVPDWAPMILRSQVDAILTRCEAEAASIAKRISDPDDNLGVIEELYARLKNTHPQAVTNIWVERLLTSILKHDLSSSEAIIIDRLAAHDAGGFQVGDKTFYDFAHEYIRALP